MRMTKLVPTVAVAVFIALPAFAQGAALTDAQVRDAIVRESVNAYLATGHPCACPYNRMRNGHQCGSVSAYIRPGGASPLCYPKDVSDAMVARWRRSHP
jgi:hypothetical protein